MLDIPLWAVIILMGLTALGTTVILAACMASGHCTRAEERQELERLVKEQMK